MVQKLLKSLLTSTLSIMPMIFIVILLALLPLNHGASMMSLDGMDYFALFFGAFLLIVGLAIFQTGTFQGLTKVGQYMGNSLSAQPKYFIIVIFAFLLGALITCAEPSIIIVSSQIEINPFLLIGSIALGVGIFVVIGVVRITQHASLKLWYLFFYFIVFLLICLIAIDDTSRQFLPFIFDAGGITTGSATVPFILALGTGIAIVRGKRPHEDSFGLVGMASIGPIITMTILLLINRSGFDPYELVIPAPYEDVGGVFGDILKALLPSGATHLGSLVEVGMALAPILIIFFVYEALYIKLPKAEVMRLLSGFLMSYFGLVIFLTGVGAIMSPFGTRVGVALGTLDSNWLIVGICFVIGLVTIVCEPAVHVLTTQINEASDGYIKKSTILGALSIGVGSAIGLSALRSVFDFNIMYIIVPGYFLSLTLMFVTPNLYTAMAFDAGGTASGPMSVSFVLPMIIGVTYSKHGLPEKSVAYYTEAFGVVALIAMMPILTIQLLGVYLQVKKLIQLRVTRGVIADPNDAQIIHF
ncbi:MAG: DUF1538 family protein [Bacilli bacterium]|nr:DUF1538 family protein [Bacilli bacterium]